MITTNPITTSLLHIRELALQDVLVNNVTQGYIEDIDFNKMNVRPFVHVQVVDIGIGNGIVNTLGLKIGALTDRIENKEVTDPTNYFSNDNLVDNQGITALILDRLTTKLVISFQDADVIATVSGKAIPYLNEALSLDGFVIDIELEIPSTGFNLCSA